MRRGKKLLIAGRKGLNLAYIALPSANKELWEFSSFSLAVKGIHR